MARAPAPVEEEVVVDEAMPVEEMAPDDEQPVVVATILKNADGSFTLQAGDEPEAVVDGEVEPMAPAMGESYAPDEDGIGRLMAAVLDLVDPENPESAQAAANFDEGFGTPPAAAPAPGM